MKLINRHCVYRNTKRQQGFTLIELMVATTVFSFVLLIASATAIQIGKLYYKGLIQAATQETARNVSDDLTRSFQFANGALILGTNNASQRQYCIGDTRYTGWINQQVAGGAEGLRAEQFSGTFDCAAGIPLPTSKRELLAENMRLLDFNVSPVGTSGKTFQINVRMTYGDNDLLTIYQPDGTTEVDVNGDGSPLSPAEIREATCRTNIAGSGFCAVSQLDNIVRKRLN